MLLVRCAYCQGTGKQKCACRSGKPLSGDGGGAETAEGREKTEQVLLRPPDNEDLSSYACGLCRDSGWITCPGCCGSGFVEMPALA